MARTKVNWVELRSGSCVCLRCGETHVFRLPMPVDDFVAAGRAFIRLHAFCRDDDPHEIRNPKPETLNKEGNPKDE